MHKDIRGWTFSLDEELLWIVESYFGQKCDLNINFSFFVRTIPLSQDMRSDWLKGHRTMLLCVLLRPP